MTTTKDMNALKGWLTGAWSNIAMVEYPYPANFLQNLPAWPIKVNQTRAIISWFTQISSTRVIGL